MKERWFFRLKESMGLCLTQRNSFYSFTPRFLTTLHLQKTEPSAEVRGHATWAKCPCRSFLLGQCATATNPHPTLDRRRRKQQILQEVSSTSRQKLNPQAQETENRRGPNNLGTQFRHLCLPLPSFFRGRVLKSVQLLPPQLEGGTHHDRATQLFSERKLRKLLVKLLSFPSNSSLCCWAYFVPPPEPKAQGNLTDLCKTCSLQNKRNWCFLCSFLSVTKFKSPGNLFSAHGNCGFSHEENRSKGKGNLSRSEGWSDLESAPTRRALHTHGSITHPCKIRLSRTIKKHLLLNICGCKPLASDNQYLCPKNLFLPHKNAL